MPPMHVNIGAWGAKARSSTATRWSGPAPRWVPASTSARRRTGGVIEPVGALPVIIEDDVLVGGNTGI